jgi:hypothetical protein
MNPHQDFIDARGYYITRAVEAGRKRGLRDEDVLVVLVDFQCERDTWPAPPPVGDADDSRPMLIGPARGYARRARSEFSEVPWVDMSGWILKMILRRIAGKLAGAVLPWSNGIACIATPFTVAQTLLDLKLITLATTPQPGFVRVLAFLESTAFFTHARITPEP